MPADTDKPGPCVAERDGPSVGFYVNIIILIRFRGLSGLQETYVATVRKLVVITDNSTQRQCERQKGG